MRSPTKLRSDKTALERGCTSSDGRSEFAWVALSVFTDRCDLTTTEFVRRPSAGF